MPVIEKLEKVDKVLVGERLKASRKSLKLTQKKVCAELGVPQSNISLYETGEYVPSANFLVTYAKKYGVSIDYLLGVTEKETTLDIRDLIDDGRADIRLEEERLIVEIKDEELKRLLEPEE